MGRATCDRRFPSLRRYEPDQVQGSGQRAQSQPPAGLPSERSRPRRATALSMLTGRPRKHIPKNRSIERIRFSTPRPPPHRMRLLAASSCSPCSCSAGWPAPALALGQRRFLYPAPSARRHPGRCRPGSRRSRSRPRMARPCTDCGGRRGRLRRHRQFHGNGSRPEPHAERFAAEPWRARGWGLLTVAYRGYPGSTGSPSEDGLIRDGLAAANAARAQAPDAPILLHGHSLVAAVASQSPNGCRRSGFTLEAPFDSDDPHRAAACPASPSGSCATHTARHAHPWRNCAGSDRAGTRRHGGAAQVGAKPRRSSRPSGADRRDPGRPRVHPGGPGPRGRGDVQRACRSDLPAAGRSARIGEVGAWSDGARSAGAPRIRTHRGAGPARAGLPAL